MVDARFTQQLRAFAFFNDFNRRGVYQTDMAVQKESGRFRKPEKDKLGRCLLFGVLCFTFIVVVGYCLLWLYIHLHLLDGITPG